MGRSYFKNNRTETMLDLIQKRRSTRNFTEQKVEKHLIDQLIKAALWSPTSKNNRPWEFVIIEDTITLKKLSQCKPHGATFVEKAPLAIVVLADPRKSDVWVEDCSIASIMMQMTAESLGLGSTWVQVRLRQSEDGNMASKTIKETIQAPSSLEVLGIMAFGYKAKERKEYTEEDLLIDKIHWEKF